MMITVHNATKVEFITTNLADWDGRLRCVVMESAETTKPSPAELETTIKVKKNQDN